MTPDGKFDPRLKACVKEIDRVIERFNCAGVVVLANGRGHSEYKLYYHQPAWAMLRPLKSGAYHIKAYMKTKPLETDMTVNALVLIHRTLAAVHSMTGGLLERIGQHLLIENNGPEVFTPHPETED